MTQPPEHPLAYLGFQTIQPGRLLNRYVQSYWYFRRDTPLLTWHDEYMHGRGGFGIVFNFGDPLRLDAQPIDQPIFLDGANTISRKLGFLGRVELIGIRFYEGGAFPFLGIPLIELQNATTLLDALGRPGLLRLYTQLYEAQTLPARIHLLEEWLKQCMLLGKTQDALVPASLNLLQKKAGQLPIPELARALAISQRQLERIYQNQVGMSPKQYARLLRVERARLALRQMDEISSASLAAGLGFYDQAHFIREFSAVVGMTPYAYLKRKKPG